MLTQEQLERRRQGIGGSDIAAVCGVSRWRGPMDVYLDKLGAVPPAEGNEAMYWGSKLEGAIRERFAEEHPEFVVVPGPESSVQHKDYPWAMALPDAMLYTNDGSGSAMYDRLVAGLEVKTASAWKRAEWDGESVPLEYIFQATWYMAVTGVHRWYMAVLIGGSEYREFEVPWDGELAGQLLERGLAFWQLVQSKTPPPIDGSDASTRLLNTLYPAAKAVPDTVQLDAEADDLARRRIALKAELKAVEAGLADVENVLKAAMGEHVRGATPGGYAITWAPRSRPGIDAKRLREDMPEVAEKYATTSTYRVLDVKEGSDNGSAE